jgi:hypothetical protein
MSSDQDAVHERRHGYIYQRVKAAEVGPSWLCVSWGWRQSRANLCKAVQNARRPAGAGLLSGIGRLGLLRLDELARLVHDDLADGDLRRIRESHLQLLLAQPVRRDAGGLVGLR